jgi:hypothetical protein
MAVRTGRQTYLATKRAGKWRRRAKTTTEDEEELAGALHYSARKTRRLAGERGFATTCYAVSAGAGVTAAVSGATVVGAPVAIVAGAVALGATIVGTVATKVPRICKWIHKKRLKTLGRGRMKNSQIILAHACKGSEAALGALTDIKAVGEKKCTFPVGRMQTEHVSSNEWDFAFWESNTKVKWHPRIEEAKQTLAEAKDKAAKKVAKKALDPAPTGSDARPSQRISGRRMHRSPGPLDGDLTVDHLMS